MKINKGNFTEAKPKGLPFGKKGKNQFCQENHTFST